MGLLSMKLGIWARCAAVAGVLFALPAAAVAGQPATKPAAQKASSRRESPNKRAAVTSGPKVERAHAASGKEQAKTVAKDGKLAKAGAPAAKKEPRGPVVPAASVGSPTEGKLVGGVKLDTSSGTVRVVPAYRRGDTRWGLPALIHMIERSAKKVAKKHPGAVLGVGDISRKNGGDIFLHRSHESGRDADIAFYVVDQRGRDLSPDTFVTFQGSVESSSMPGARFDVAKNWALVQAMLEDPEARVSHVFVADPLRRMLLAHAKPRVSPALYARAAAVMMQPSNALPHDNHFHVRISCPSSMRKSCVEHPPLALLRKKSKGSPALAAPGAKAGGRAVAALKAPPKKGAGAAAEKVDDARAKAQKARPPVAAVPKTPLAAPRSGPVERKLASAGSERKKPIYLQSAVANTDDPLDRVLFSVPALSHLGGAEPEADADAEVKSAVDETGTVKITE